MTALLAIDSIHRVAVVGAGTMGRGIALVTARAGWAVALYDAYGAVLDAAVASIKETLEKGVSRGKMTKEERDETLLRIHLSTSLFQAVHNADVVFEAIPEQLALKQSLFTEIDRTAPPHTLFATNTSSLSVGAIAKAITRPGRLLGMHFFNPVHAMRLVEIVHHRQTSQEAIALAQALTLRMGKEAICVRDVPGFASSRLGICLGLEAIRMVEQGVATAQDIDLAMKLGYGHPLGPLELTDWVGLDVRLAIAEYLAAELGPQFTPPELLRRLVTEGKLGRKTGEGFYRYTNGFSMRTPSII